MYVKPTHFQSHLWHLLDRSDSQIESNSVKMTLKKLVSIQNGFSMCKAEFYKDKILKYYFYDYTG